MSLEYKIDYTVTQSTSITKEIHIYKIRLILTYRMRYNVNNLKKKNGLFQIKVIIFLGAKL